MHVLQAARKTDLATVKRLSAPEHICQKSDFLVEELIKLQWMLSPSSGSETELRSEIETVLHFSSSTLINKRKHLTLFSANNSHLSVFMLPMPSLQST